MKRHPDLREFSDDHHRGLVNALRLRRAASGEGAAPAQAARAFLGFWREETGPHFRKEEEVLLPVLARHGEEALDREPVVEMLLQHARIRSLAMRVSDEAERGAVRGETLWELGELLEAHIRLEERVVFPMIEEVLPEDALKEVASRLEVFEGGARPEPWVPTEGLSFNPWPGPGGSEGGGWD
jgi:hemerythrin-like domain-containing protein